MPSITKVRYAQLKEKEKEWSKARVRIHYLEQQLALAKLDYENLKMNKEIIEKAWLEAQMEVRIWKGYVKSYRGKQ
jgi:chromosome segregation ATPase